MPPLYIYTTMLKGRMKGRGKEGQEREKGRIYMSCFGLVTGFEAHLKHVKPLPLILEYKFNEDNHHDHTFQLKYANISLALKFFSPFTVSTSFRISVCVKREGKHAENHAKRQITY